MRNRERNVVAACADTMFPPNGPIPVSGTQAGLVDYFVAYAAALPRMQQLLIRLLLLFIQLSPFLFGPRRARFTRLTPDERLIALKQMSVSATYFRRVASLSMRTILTMGYFANPRGTVHIMALPDSDVQSLDEEQS